jgi:glycogen(starch) synthase
MGHFFPSYTFDLDRTLYLFTAGRYEYRNKGFDLYLEALYRLNQRMRGMADPPTVIAFIVTRAQVRKHQRAGPAEPDDVRRPAQHVQRGRGADGPAPVRVGGDRAAADYAELMPEDAQVRLKRAMHAWRKTYQPLIVTHDLADDANDPVLKHLRHRGLLNGPDDPVKVVFHPEFVTATSPTISLDYEQFVRGCHAGHLPELLRAVGLHADGVHRAGRAGGDDGPQRVRRVREQPPVRRRPARASAAAARATTAGILVLNRRERGFDDTVDALVHYLLQFTQLNRRQRIELRNHVERQGEHFDWSVLVATTTTPTTWPSNAPGRSGSGRSRSGWCSEGMQRAE